MPTINNFEDLTVWQEAREMSKLIYELGQKNGYKSHDHLRLQLERSSGSVMDNIAEGFERGSNKEFIQYLYIAKASCGESRSQLYRSFDYNIINSEDLAKHVTHTKNLGKKIFSFIHYLKNSPYKGDKYNNVSEPREAYGDQNEEWEDYVMWIQPAEEQMLIESNSEASNFSNSKASNLE